MGRFLLVLAVLSSGCSTVLSTMQPAQTTPGKHVRGATALGVNIPAGQLADTIDAAETIAESGMVDMANREEFLQGVVGLFMNPPAFAQEFQVRYGFSDIVDVGLRYATGGNIRADMRYRVINPEQPDGMYGSTGLGFTFASASIPVPSPIDEFIEIDSITRIELDLPMLFGWSNEIWHFWFGPKFVLSFVSTGLTFRDMGPVDDTPERVDASATNFYYVAHVGAAVGFRHIWVALELTIGGIGGAADISPQGGEKFEAGYSGLVLYPALGLLLQF
jgi:hypothetical protein